MTEFHRVLVYNDESHDQTIMTVNNGRRAHTAHALRLESNNDAKTVSMRTKIQNIISRIKVDSTQIFRLKIDSRMRC
jgi:hypothetical protein